MRKGAEASAIKHYKAYWKLPANRARAVAISAGAVLAARCDRLTLREAHEHVQHGRAFRHM